MLDCTRPPLEAVRQGSTGRNFAYLFTRRSPATGGEPGACHAIDVPFVFRHLDSPEAAFLTRGQAPQSLSNAMSGAWQPSPRAGSPGLRGLDWPDYGPERNTMLLDAAPRVEPDPRREIREFFAANQVRRQFGR